MIADVAKLLLIKDFHSRVLEELKAIMVQGRAQDLLCTMLEITGQEETTPEVSVLKIMNVAQELFSSDPTAACIIMSQLYNFADNLYMHDVCDSIDIWIYQHHSLELGTLLKKNFPSDIDDDMKRHYQGWVDG